MKQFLTMMFACGAAFAQTKSTVPATKAKSAVKKAVKPAHNLMIPSTMRDIAPAVYKAKFITTQGNFVVQVTRAWAPLGADRFYNLVLGKYFDGAPFFRVIPKFMAQFGINPDPKVNAIWNSQNLVDDAVKLSNKRGYITFATAGPNTRTTQLFINYADNPGLDAQGFAPFGEVVEGMDVVDKFNSEYGGNPDQGALQQLGKPWIEKNMPRVDIIKTAMIIAPAPVAPVVAPKAPAVRTAATKSTSAGKSTTAARPATAAKSTAAKSTAVKSTTAAKSTAAKSTAAKSSTMKSTTTKSTTGTTTGKQ